MSRHNYQGFKAYDIRGKVGVEITDELVEDLGRAIAKHLQAKKIVLGSDVRLTSPKFKQLLAKGIQEQGADVIDIGTTGTEEVYFATSFLDADGGIQVTASHNPIDYNGFKIVGKNSVPLSSETGLNQIKDLIEANQFTLSEEQGSYQEVDCSQEYIDKLLSFVNVNGFKEGKKLRLLFNIGNGVAGASVKKLEERLKQAGANLEFIYQFPEPDGNFPNGIPNPLLVENREATSKAVLENKADLGIAFDGDFDRCFFFDSQGRFIDGYYICGLLAKAFLLKNQGAAIVYEPRLMWNTQDVIENNGGKAVLSKSGHSFIKKTLREVNAVYGGEMSAHHYFRDYFYCDSGMIPWLIIVELLQNSEATLAEMVKEMQNNYPCSDEINFKVESAEKAIANIKAFYAAQSKEESTIDGLSYDFGNWRFNVRSSNTEPLLRLNVESRGDKELVSQKVEELSHLITSA